MSATPKVATIVHALNLVASAHRARLSEATRSVAEKIARQEGATREDLDRAIARGMRALAVFGAAVLTGCASAPAVPEAAVADTVITLGADVRMPGRFAGMSDGAEVWDMGDVTVRVRRVQP